ncbi:hypothetical protein L1080_003175 [Rhodococcus sp. MSC1_016]|jgi:uncharacterized protein with PIN domain|uniref:hypothetical protein n=1 Tax=Rhodococcus sp. MSC1_016 TaxID=2909266 RepID=UPI00202ECE92|nr:hypothetical protein [Rhodococcus sp. MSC1_016]
MQIDVQRAVWDIPDTPDEVAQRAMRTVAANSTDATDAAELLAMLGLIDVDTEVAQRCAVCNHQMVNRNGSDLRPRPPGVKTVGAKGMCNTCYQVTLRPDRPQVGGVA